MSVVANGIALFLEISCDVVIGLLLQRMSHWHNSVQALSPGATVGVEGPAEQIYASEARRCEMSLRLKSSATGP